MTLEELCRLVHSRKVQVHIGVHKDDVLASPPIVTIQVHDPADKFEPRAFRMPLVRGNPNQERALSVALKQRIDAIGGQKMRLVKTLDELASEQ